LNRRGGDANQDRFASLKLACITTLKAKFVARIGHVKKYP
jgi:hypothetical protein